MVERIALYHHERWVGYAYFGLKGEDILLEARTVSIVDVFYRHYALTPYKEAPTFGP
jgi:response regulator RpfG family c-di-GMP phosphodiesterase